ncbi:MAG: YceI family protein [Actinomycetota bacterium]|nr:YceI family protein [Actinomycetota bacterium]
MTIAKGTHNIGPQDGKLLLNVYKDGVAAKMGHDLTFEVTSWSGKADIDPDNPSASSVQVSIDPGSLEIIDSKGGAKQLSDGDRKDIKKNIDKALQTSKYNSIDFQCKGVSGTPPRVSLQGNLTLVGQIRRVTLDLTVDYSGHAQGRTSFAQSQFGIKPFSAMLGALKIKDNVDISIDLRLPTA